MEQLRQIVLILLALGAPTSLAVLVGAFYEFKTGRLVRVPFRRKIPATLEDTRKNGLALILNDLSALLVDMILLSELLLQANHPDPLLAVAYFAVSAAGLAASLLSTWIAFQIRSEVRYQVRKEPGPLPWSQP